MVRNTTGRVSTLAALSLLTLVGGSCAEADHIDDPVPLGQRSQEIAGDWNDAKIAVDAPWRMQPFTTASGERGYGKVPIQLTIHDSENADDNLFGDAIKRVVAVTVRESDPSSGGAFGGGRTYAPSRFHEIERVDRFAYTPETFSSSPCRDPAACRQLPQDHQICRGWDGFWAGCDIHEIDEAIDHNEWHGTILYPLRYDHRPGEDVTLSVVAILEEEEFGHNSTHRVTTTLEIHLAEEPLPKFSNEWAYGDLHYHSQLTNNFGEQGYNFRGTLRAMASIGLDFAYATDHSSNNRRIFDGFDDGGGRLEFRGLGDASPSKWAWGHRLLNGPRGANSEVLSNLDALGTGTRAVPQMFMGSEVDVIPEVPAPGDVVGFRNITYDAEKLCEPDVPMYGCSLYERTDDGTYLVRDRQGPVGLGYARQHIVHLPFDSRRDDAGVFGDTSTYGGGTRRLKDMIAHDLDREEKGYMFLAHPFLGPTGGVTAVGPDIVPYTEPQLKTALRSRYMLGLQLWNENTRFEAEVDSGGIWVDIEPDWDSAQRTTQRFERDMRRMTSAWDAVQLMALDRAFSDTIEWLKPGEPRRVLMAGGSDAHGDFNFRREGRVSGVDQVNDTRIGSPRNLVFTGPPERRIESPTTNASAMAYSQEQVATGLEHGQFCITDGPALRIVYDVNKNGIIDDDDVPMGHYYEGVLEENPVVLVEWLSTPEFGNLFAIDLFVGVYSDVNGQSALYRPRFTGDAHRQWTDTTSNRTMYVEEDAGGQVLIDRELGLRKRDDAAAPNVVAFELDLDRLAVPGEIDEQSFELRDFAPPTRLFVRAMATTDYNLSGTRRFAYTNPVWLIDLRQEFIALLSILF